MFNVIVNKIKAIILQFLAKRICGFEYRIGRAYIVTSGDIMISPFLVNFKEVG